MRILVSGENRHIRTGDARRMVKYKGYRWTGLHGKSPIERDLSWRPASQLIAMQFPGYDYPEMTLIPETPGNRYPRILHQKREHTYGFERACGKAPAKAMAAHA